MLHTTTPNRTFKLDSHERVKPVHDRFQEIMSNAAFNRNSEWKAFVKTIGL